MKNCLVIERDRIMKKTPKGYSVPLRDNRFPIPGDMPDMEFDDRSEFFKHLMMLKMREERMSDEERTSPDSFGCDSVFLDFFYN